jgi:hypothetical protein
MRSSNARSAAESGGESRVRPSLRPHTDRSFGSRTDGHAGDRVAAPIGGYADWLDEPVAALLRQHLRDRSDMTTAANPASPWLFPGQLAGEHRSYRRLVRVLHQLGIPARASRLAAWRELVGEAPPAVLADALGVPPGAAMRHAFFGGADWSACAGRRHAHTPDDKTS